jgi:hypothetical protein
MGANLVLGLLISGTAAGLVILCLGFTLRGLQWVKREHPQGILLIVFLLAVLGFWLVFRG